MPLATLYNPALSRPIDKKGVAWFFFVHALSLVAILHLWLYWHPLTLGMAVAYYAACHIGVTAGLHRLHSHRSYKAVAGLEFVLLILSAATLQKNDAWWAYQHRLHHRYSDTPRDPYTVLHGFWWAHFWWILYSSDEIDEAQIKDLVRNKLVMWQLRYYFPIAITMGLGLPATLGALWGDWLGGLLVGGFLRLMVQYHSTWAINSVAHTFGFRRYLPEGTARLSPYLMLISGGENYHERHHLAHEDYRLGPKWYHLDAGKWFINFCALFGWAYDLRTVPEEQVLLRAERAQSAA